VSADLDALDRGVVEAGVIAAAAVARVKELEAAVASLARRLAAAEALARQLAAQPCQPPDEQRIADLGHRLLGAVDEIQAAAEEEQITGYDRAAAVQARRQQIHLVGPVGGQQ
jgi:hypothetical protein